MKIDDGKIKNLIVEYLRNQNEKILEGIKKELGEYIYYFPRLAYKKNPDICGEFYLYILERFDKIIKNFPLKASVKFQTWFNYVLKNNFINFTKYIKNIENNLSLDDYKDTIYIEIFEKEDTDYDELYKAFDKIDSSDRVILKLCYMPELINEKDLKHILEKFKISVSETLELQKRLIQLRFEELENTRKACEKIRILNSKILDIRYAIYSNNPENNEKHEMLTKIARLEGERFKCFQKINSKNKEIINCIAHLFGTREKASYRIKIAKEKLKFYLLKLKQPNVGS